MLLGAETSVQCKNMYFWKALATNKNTSQGPGQNQVLPVTETARLMEGLAWEAAQ